MLLSDTGIYPYRITQKLRKTKAINILTHYGVGETVNMISTSTNSTSMPPTPPPASAPSTPSALMVSTTKKPFLA